MQRVGPLWARAVVAPGTGYFSRPLVAAGADGSCIVAATFSRRAQLADGRGSHRVVDARSGSTDVVVARYDGRGELTWVTRLGGAAYEDAVEVRTAADGSVVVAGGIRERVAPSDYRLSAWLAFVGPDGCPASERRTAGRSDTVEGLARLADGRVAVAANFGGETDLAPEAPGGRRLEAAVRGVHSGLVMTVDP